MALLPLWSGVDLLGRHGGSRWSLPDDLHEWPTILQSGAANQLRDLRTQLTHLDRSSSLTIDKEHFQANIDVQQFRPDEISVRLLDDHSVKVEAKHEEQQDDHGFISRHFVRRYLLPKDCDPTKLKSKLSADGILVITAPKKQEDDAIEGQEIPISHVRPFISRPHLWPSHYGFFGAEMLRTPSLDKADFNFLKSQSSGSLYRRTKCLETNPCSSCFSSCLPSTFHGNFLWLELLDIDFRLEMILVHSDRGVFFQLGQMVEHRIEGMESFFRKKLRYQVSSRDSRSRLDLTPRTFRLNLTTTQCWKCLYTRRCASRTFSIMLANCISNGLDKSEIPYV
ncbi:hypothetical protein HUJ05_006482 [Dendroctonus ponderosae]|nr:hypothetical protein HUJ05_006482 [Dendroctonus ponderosae]